MLNKYNIPEAYETSYEDFSLRPGAALVASDLHIPYHNIPAINAMIDFALRYKIDTLLINGDLMDQHTFSKFLIDPRKRKFKEELESTNILLDIFNEVFPEADKVIKLGNHDERYEKYMMLKAPELIGIAEFKLANLLHTYAKHIKVIEDKRIINAGSLSILHGHEVNMRGTTVNPARTLYLKVKKSCVCSHLHASSQHTEKRLDGHLISTWSIGHLAEEHPEYAPINNWNLGFAIIQFDAEFFEVSNYKIIHNKVYRS